MPTAFVISIVIISMTSPLASLSQLDALVNMGSQEESCGRDRNCGPFHEEWVVHVSGGRSTARQVARQMKLVLVDELRGFPDHYIFKAPREHSKDLNRNKRHASIVTSPHVNWAQQQVPRIRQKRASLPNMNWNDPNYADMWYINRASQGKGYDMNVQEAWHLGYSGKGVVVTIMDDGIDYTHPDLQKNYDPKASVDLTDRDDDPMPDLKTSENNRHGTRCAGQVAACGNNSVCVVGVAYNAHIGGIRMLDGYITDRVEAESLGFQHNHIDIFSGSWGPEDTGRMHEGPGFLAASAIQKGVTTGRHGLGNIYVWASGNGGQAGDSCACDGYASSPHTLSVSGVGERNRRPWYLEKCSSTLITTYSSGSSSERMIATVDAHHRCTNEHTGTSAAAPLAASIIALLLEANPKLTWRDVQYITLLTANPAPFVDGNFTKNALGRAYSQFYGYGLMDAGKMVRLGEIWRTVPQQHQCTSMVHNFKIPLERRFNHTIELNFTGCSSTHTPANPIGRANASGAHPLHYLEHVQIYSEIIYPRRGLLQVTLISPSGTESVLLPPRILDDHSGETNILKWPLTSVQFWGESAIGTWKVRLDNLAGMDDLQRLDQQRLQDMFRRLPQHRRQLQSLHQAAQMAHTLQGSWRSVWLVFYGTTEFPIRLKPPAPDRQPPADWFAKFSSYVVHDSAFYDVYKCHSQCAPGGCTGPLANQCLGGCLHFVTQSRHCVETCPMGTTPYRISKSPDGTFARQRRASKLPTLPSNQRLPGQGQVDPTKDDGELVCQPCSSFCSSCVRPHAEFECTGCADDRYLVPILMPNQSGRALSSSSEEEEDKEKKGMSTTSVGAGLPASASVGVCRTDCPLGYYANKVTGICQPCSENCAHCTSPRVGDCQECYSGYRLMNGRCLDGQSVDGLCRLGQFIQHSKCVNCPSWCSPAGCLTSGECISCRHPNVYLYNHTCVDKCPAGWYPGYPIMAPYTVEQGPSTGPAQLPPLRLCEPCPPGCSHCLDFSVCRQCADQLQLVNGSCVNAERASSQPECSSPCSTCLYASDDCASCAGHTGHLLALNHLLLSAVGDSSHSLRLLLSRRRPLHVTGKGVAHRAGQNLPTESDRAGVTPTVPTAPGGQVEGGKKSSPSTTTTTTTISSGSSSTNGSLPVYTCSVSCPTATFVSLTGIEGGSSKQRVCRACPPACLACIDSDRCTSCRTSFHLDPEKAECLPDEPCRASSYYDLEEKTCVPCHAKCDTCLGPTANDCTSCPRNSALPHCLDLGEADKLAATVPTDYPDSVDVVSKGQCLACCDYRRALRTRMLPAGCGFCLAGRMACLSQTVMQVEEYYGWLIFPDDGARHHLPIADQNASLPASPGSPSSMSLIAIVLICLFLLACLLVVIMLVYWCCQRYCPLAHRGKPGDRLCGAGRPVSTAVSQRAARAHAHHLQAMEDRRVSSPATGQPALDQVSTPLITNGVPSRYESACAAQAVELANSHAHRWQQQQQPTPSARDPHQHVLYSQLTQSTIDQLEEDDRSSLDGNDTVCITHGVGGREEACNRRLTPRSQRHQRLSVPVGEHSPSNGFIPASARSNRQSNGPQTRLRLDQEETSKPLLSRPPHRRPLN